MIDWLYHNGHLRVKSLQVLLLSLSALFKLSSAAGKDTSSLISNHSDTISIKVHRVMRVRPDPSGDAIPVGRNSGSL